MTTVLPRTTAGLPGGRRARFLRALRAQLVTETRLMLRAPAALIFGAVLPVAAIVVMSVLPAARVGDPAFGGLSVIQAFQPTIVLFSTSILGLTVVPAVLGGYRQQGVLRRLRTTPASPAVLLAALFVVVAAAGILVGTLLVAIPVVAGAGLPAHLATFALAAVLSLVAFLALGTVLAAVVPSPQAAAGIGNVIAAVMWFCAGLWLPRAHFPAWLTFVTDLTPGGAAARMMLDAGLGVGLAGAPLVVLLGWTVIAAAVAVRTFRWE